MDVNIVYQLLLALWLGALIWVERWVMAKNETKTKSIVSFWEIRTFSLIAALWALTAWMSTVFSSPLFIVFGLLVVTILITVYYVYATFKSKQYGLTTEIAAIITFLLWVLVMVWHGKEAIVFSILLTFVLSSKSYIENILQKVSSEWLNNTIKFAIISIVVLPLLPDQKYSITELLQYLWFTGEINNAVMNLAFFNPYWLWLFVVLMSGISYAWYIMSKVIWEKGSIVASWAIWGLISSTAVTASMTQASKTNTRNTDLYVVSTLLASTIMFIRVIIIVLFFNINMISSIIYPSMFMLIWMVAYIIYFYLKSKKKTVVAKNLDFEEKKYSSPFSIWPALKFAWFVLIIKFIAWLWALYQDIWWDYFFYALWLISWLADVDAVSQTMAVDSIDWKVAIELAAMTIIIAVISNNFVKWWIAYNLWNKQFWRYVMFWFIISMIMWVVGMFFM